VTRICTFYIYGPLFALGIVGAQLSPVTLPAWLATLIGVLVCPGLLIPALRPAVFCLAGVLWALFRAGQVLEVAWPAPLEGRDVELVGTVADLPQRAERYLKFDLDVERAWFEDEPVEFAGRIRLRWYEPSRAPQTTLKAGSAWRLRVRLKQPHGYYNPGGFDYEAYLFREDIRATGYVRQSDSNERIDDTEVHSLASLRQAIRDRLDLAMDGLQFKGLLRALALGDRSSISNSDWEALRATGTNHLIAISGLHVGMAAGVGALLGLWLGRIATIMVPRVAAPQIAALSALAFALVYAGLSGFEVPAQRAFIMATVFLLAVVCRRHAWNVRGLLMALIAVLVVDPASVHDPGFWLSFFAVALILAWLGGRDERSRRGAVVEAVKLQWVLSLALLPLVAAFFGTISLVAAPANMIAVPVVMFTIVPLCLLSVVAVAAGYPAIASACLAPADRVLELLWTLLTAMSEMEYAHVALDLEIWQALALLSGILWLMLGKSGTRKWSLVCALVLFVPGPGVPAHGEFRLVVLDVGQGLSVVVATENRTLVYDTGPRYPSGFSLADAVVTPYLRSNAVEQIDTLVISHGDNDHRGGYEDLRSAFPVGRVLSSVAFELRGARYCVEGQSWMWDGVRFEILHPETTRSVAHNNASCMIRISSSHGSVLLTGDIEAEAEYSLLRRRSARLNSDVLLVPHHGSATSSTEAFLDHVDPAWAIVSAGYVNRYGHPRPEIMERYRARRIETINTAASGAVTVEVRGEGIEVTGRRQTRPRYWLDRDDTL
jgi:competence protein ComEC